MGEPDTQTPEPWPYKEADLHGWPAAPEPTDGTGFNAELAKAKLEVRKARTDQEIARAQAKTDADIAVLQQYYASVFEVAKGAIDRSRASAETVQKAAAAIVTLYTGVLALAFSVAESPLPAKALFAAVLLGFAILLSTAFLAYLPDPEDDKPRRSSQDAEGGATIGEQVTNLFVVWTRRAALARGRILRASVVALAGAVALMPAPFITIGEKQVTKAEIGWPTPDEVAADTPALQKIVYAAQVAEVAEQRKQPLAQESADEWWTRGFVCALLLVLASYVFPRSKHESKVKPSESEPAMGSGAAAGTSL